MKFANSISGTAPHYRRYKVAAAHAIGIAVVRAAADSTGLSTSTTTSAAKMVGVTQDQGADYNAGTNIPYSTTQGDKEAVYKVLINPDAIFRLLMNGGATDGTALAEKIVGTAASNGLSVTPTPAYDYTNPQMDEGMLYCTLGNNVGLSRKITSTSATAVTVIMPFPNATAVGDKYIALPYFPGQAPKVQLTSNLKNADASIAVGTGAGFSVVDLELFDASTSNVLVVSSDHVFGGQTS